MDITRATPLLGGLSAQQFMRRHWQKTPLVIREAMAGVTPPLTRAALFALVQSDEVESRLVVRHGDGWALKHGPFSRRALPPLAQAGWTLLVQGLDLHVDAARALLDRFRFVPDARLDDLMLSYASDGGGVGAHVDSYDVFLLQVHGRRRWRIGRQRELTLRADLPLKILAHFTAEQEFVLDPGDMLYLPPRWAHEGVAIGGDCMTCSIGLRAPGRFEIGQAVLQRALDANDAPDSDVLYRDPRQPASPTPGRIPAGLEAFALDAVARFTHDPQALACALGEVLSEPKPRVVFGTGEAALAGAGVRLDRRSRMLYDERRIYLNGESYSASGRDRVAMRRLADERCLGALELARLSAGARELLGEWAAAGWLHNGAECKE